MLCEQCGQKMNWRIEGSTQGWNCPACGWGVVTTYISQIDADQTEYSLYMKNVSEIDLEKIRFVAQTANVNFLTARQMLEEKEVCLIKAKASKIKETIVKMQGLNIEYSVFPAFYY